MSGDDPGEARPGWQTLVSYYFVMKNNPSFLPRSFALNSVAVRERILRWFEREGRQFSWRLVERAIGARQGEPIDDPYMILVSEVMLQQTQTARVAVKLPEFLALFPTVDALASASRGALIRAWQGMGYNRRALRLQEAAQAVVDRYDGRFPRSVEELQTLPGIGRYTASAVACFAFGEEVPVVDVNIIRVFSRIFFKCHTAAQIMPQGIVDRLAEAIAPPGDYYRWHQGLMDLGATICTARRPACGRCPVSDLCFSAFPMELELFGARHAASREPEIRGEPRRIWRGRIVEVLRRARLPMRVGGVIDDFFPPGLFESVTTGERRALLAAAAALLDEGLIVRGGVVREGDLQEDDLIMLPE